MNDIKVVTVLAVFCFVFVNAIAPIYTSVQNGFKSADIYKLGAGCTASLFPVFSRNMEKVKTFVDQNGSIYLLIDNICTGWNYGTHFKC